MPAVFAVESRLARALSAANRAVAGLAALAGAWTVGQLWFARQQVPGSGLWPAALVVYAGGMEYLALSALIAWRSAAPLVAAPWWRYFGAAASCLAHAIILAAAIGIARRGFEARGLLVGLGESLAAWSVVAVLAAVREALSLLPVARSATAIETARSRGLVRWKVASLGCALVVGIGLYSLERLPLPSSPRTEPASSKQIAGGHHGPGTDSGARGVGRRTVQDPRVPARQAGADISAWLPRDFASAAMTVGRAA